MYRRSLVLAIMLTLTGTTLAGTEAAVAQTTVLPMYRVDVVVPDGVATAINEVGDIVGWQYQSGSNPRAFVHSAGTLTLLPTAADRPLSVARDINDARVVVGYAYKTTIDEPGNAMRWTPDGAGSWTVTDLGFLSGDLVSEATGINEAGVIVGRSNPRSFLYEHGFLYSDAQGITTLLPNETFVPQDINENGVVAGNGYSTAKRVDTETGAVTNLNSGSEYSQGYAYALNDAGQVAGTVVSLFGNGASVARYTDGIGWQTLGGLGGGSCSGCVDNIGWGINSAGTVVGTGWPRLSVSPPYERGVIYLDSAARLLYVDDLLEAGGQWSVFAAFDINDAGQIAGHARNVSTGQWAAVRLTPLGTLAVPAAPSGLTATPHQALTVDDQNRIDLRWSDNSNNETGFEIGRRIVDGAGTPLTSFARLVNLSANVTTYADTALALGVRYEYRVRAAGIAGPSAFSASAFAWAPSSTPETVKPTVMITSPVSLTTVSGSIPVTISATDNVGVVRVELVVDTALVGTCALGTGSTYSCKWDTRKWSNGGWTLYARAWDKAGNLGIDAITVFVSNKRRR